MKSSTIISSTVSPSPKTSQTVGYYAAFVALGLVTAALGPTLPGLAAHTQTSLHKISILFTALSLGYLLGSLLGGRLFDRLKGHTVMTVVLIILALMTALVPLISIFWLLTFVLLILGIAAGMLDVGGNALLVWVHRDKVGPYMSGLHFFFGVGAFLSPIIIAQAMRVSGGIRWPYWLLALLILPVILWIPRLPSPAIQRPSEESVAHKASFSLVALIALFLFLYVGAEIGFGGWIYTYAVTLSLSDEGGAAYLTSAFWGSLTLGRLLAIPMAARLRPRLILLGDLLGCLASIVIVLLWPSSQVAVWLGTLGLGFSMASIFPTTLTLAERRLTITGQVTGWFIVGASAGSMFLPWLIGQMFESLGPRVMMFTILVDLVVASVILAVSILYSTQVSPAERECYSGEAVC